jgi:threonine dehydrogenase-like Zn-dependent dehydrogenase
MQPSTSWILARAFRNFVSAPPPGVPPGCVLGHELAGEVVAVGAEVDGWRAGALRPGDTVLVRGGGPIGLAAFEAARAPTAQCKPILRP